MGEFLGHSFHKLCEVKELRGSVSDFYFLKDAFFSEVGFGLGEATGASGDLIDRDVFYFAPFVLAPGGFVVLSGCEGNVEVGNRG